MPDPAASREQALASLPLLRHLPPPALKSLVLACEWRSHAAGALIVGYEEPAAQIFFIISGRVRISYYAPCGREVWFSDLNAGDLFGEVAALDGGARSASAVAVAPTALAVLPAGRFRDLVQSQGAFALVLLARLAGRVRALSTRVAEFSTQAVRTRVRAELLRLAAAGTPVAGGILVSPAPTHAEIADRIATHREAVTREMNALVRAGALERQRARTLLIRDHALLAALARDRSEG